MDLATGVCDFCAKAAGASSKSTLLISALTEGRKRESLMGFSKLVAGRVHYLGAVDGHGEKFV